MVRKQPVVTELPAKEVANEEDRGGSGGACHVSLVGGGWERYSVAGRLAVPLEPSDAAFGDRHRKCVVGDESEVVEKLINTCGKCLK